MTVRLAQDMGMKTVAEYAERFGVYDKMLPVLSMSLGAGETTVLRMVTAYSVIANGGQSITPSMIDRIQDRYGKTVFKHDGRQCEGCNAQQWSNQEEPTLIDNRDQVLDPMTAYQITSMMEGVVQRGTAQLLKSLDRPLAGKTGTTNDEKTPGLSASRLTRLSVYSWVMTRQLRLVAGNWWWSRCSGLQGVYGPGSGWNAEG